ncbi:hypothetical protein [Pseudoalteromonas marina]|uniref:Transposase n=1 Tax=Pseudoalteromonas marina TaxID=267375 RepID=A0ABT9FCU2_9GAMM|nr:hypothetical protein [Pseudoalteromonas marina]MDP2564455.1 hypothetical protein [Pseudoalteromonas marina]
MTTKKTTKRQDTGIAVLAKANGLNPTLALKRNRTISNLITLSKLHKKINNLIDETNNLPRSKLNKIKLNMSKIESVEFQMQKEWGFDLCRENHTHWKRIKHCKCDKTTNVRHFSINRTCPIHTNPKLFRPSLAVPNTH